MSAPIMRLRFPAQAIANTDAVRQRTVNEPFIIVACGSHTYL